MDLWRDYRRLCDSRLFVRNPAAGFVQIANEAGAETVELNLEPGEQQSQFKKAFYGKASVVVGQYFDDLPLVID